MDATENKSVLLLSMPFADISLPSIQLSLLEPYLKQRGINASSIHLYLFAAECYGINHYLSLINSPNDAYSSQMIFSKYVFPKHWKENYAHFKEFYERNNSDNQNDSSISFETHCEKTEIFYQWMIDNVPWKDYDIIGFSLNYGQLLPSLSLAQDIKRKDQQKIIVFGGSTTMNDLGCRIMEAFDCIDYIVSGDGEESLFQLATLPIENYRDIPGLAYRTKDCVIHQNSPCCIDLTSLPFLDFSRFYQNLGMVSSAIQQFFQLNGRLPIEISRGCWWNRCTFCNQQACHSYYREKQIDRFIDELNFLSETYQMLSFQLMGSTLPRKDLKELCHKIIALKKDFSFIAEARADHLRQEDYYLLSQAGFHILQTGIETFSENYIRKMDKGCRIIDNIAALKFCKQFGITNEYNLIIHFPNEEPIDFQQTIENISLFQEYLDPPNLSRFMVGFQSPVYNDLIKYNIKSIELKRSDKIMFPDHILKKNIHFFYDFQQIKETKKNDWESLVKQWKHHRKKREMQSCQSAQIIDSLIFYYIDGGTFIKIFDKRFSDNINIYILNKDEREVFLNCTDIVTFEQLKNNCNSIHEETLQIILNDLTGQKILFHEDGNYLSLPLSWVSTKPLDWKLEKHHSRSDICIFT